jgi:hypothetical protein
MTTIYPYLSFGKTWVFDDARTGLKAEAFVAGCSEAITRLVQAKSIPAAEKGFALSFSDRPFDGHDAELSLQRDGGGDGCDVAPPLAGNWYGGVIGGERMTGWLCPALLLYFAAPPETLYVRADPLPAGMDPLWHVRPDDPRQRRFVSADVA